MKKTDKKPLLCFKTEKKLKKKALQSVTRKNKSSIGDEHDGDIIIEDILEAE